MYDSQGGGSAVAGIHRKFKQHGDETFSPSYGVRMGFIKDPNWPPSQFPEGSTAQNRRFRRVACEFSVRIGGTELKATGNLSFGGAMFVLPRAFESRTAEVVLGSTVAKCEVIETSSHGTDVTYRARFIDRTQAAALWDAALAPRG